MKTQGNNLPPSLSSQRILCFSKVTIGLKTRSAASPVSTCILSSESHHSIPSSPGCWAPEPPSLHLCLCPSCLDTESVSPCSCADLGLTLSTTLVSGPPLTSQLPGLKVSATMPSQRSRNILHKYIKHKILWRWGWGFGIHSKHYFCNHKQLV